MKYALIIGNNKYEEPKLAQLRTPAADSQALAKILGDKGIGSFDKVIPVIDQPENQIRRSISSFLLDKKPEDLVLVYFSGHGILDDRGRLFLASRDTQVNLLKATATPSSFITDELDSCRSKRQILILDCCHSGAYARGTKGEQKAVTEATFEGNGYGRVVLTASASTQYALEGDQILEQSELSLFTHFLLEGLQTGKADSNNDGVITLDEWYDYTYEQVISQTPNQIPHKWSYSQQGDLVIARNPYAKKRIIELPFEIVQATDSPFTTVRENAVIELGKLLRSRELGIVDLAYSALEKMIEDDSRKVSSTAQKILTEFKEKQKNPTIAPVINPVRLEPKFTETQKPLKKSPFLVQILELISLSTNINRTSLLSWFSAYLFLLPAIPMTIFYREDIKSALSFLFSVVINFFKLPNITIALLSYTQGPFAAISIIVSVAIIQQVVMQKRKHIEISWIIFTALALTSVSMLFRLTAINFYYSFVNKFYGSYWDSYTVAVFFITLFLGLAGNFYIGLRFLRQGNLIYPFIQSRTGLSIYFWNKWIFASLIGFSVWSIISFVLPNSYLVKYSVFGAIIGFSQWLVLQPRIKSWWWTLLNIGVGIFLSFFLSQSTLYYWCFLLWYVLNFSLGLFVYLRISKKE